MEVSKKIQEARRQSGLSQKELGDLIGVDRSTVSKWERGINKISSEDLDNIIKVLHLDDNYFEEQSHNTENFSDYLDAEEVNVDINHRNNIVNRNTVFLRTIFLLMIIVTVLIILNNNKSDTDNYSINKKNVEKEISDVSSDRHTDIFLEYNLKIDSYFGDSLNTININLNGILSKTVNQQDTLSFYALSKNYEKSYKCEDLKYDPSTGCISGTVNVPIEDDLHYCLMIDEERYMLSEGDASIYQLDQYMTPEVNVELKEYVVSDNEEIQTSICVNASTNMFSYVIDMSYNIIYLDVYRNGEFIERLKDYQKIEDTDIRKADDTIISSYLFNYSIPPLANNNEISFRPVICLKRNLYAEIQSDNEIVCQYDPILKTINPFTRAVQ